MLNLRFGIDISSLDAEQKTSFGSSTVGMESLLSILETYLGLKVPLVTRVERVFQMQYCLQRSNLKNCFWQRSFEVDPLATASHLLKFRDELFLAGWNGKIPDSASNRVSDFSKLHRVVNQSTSPGIGERLLRIRDRIDHFDSSWLEVTCLDDLDSIPKSIRTVLDCLGTAPGPVLTVSADSGSDLHRVQQRILNGNSSLSVPLMFKGDGSIQVIEADTPSLLAHYASRLHGDGSTLYVVNDAQDLFDQSLRLAGLPGIGSTTQSHYLPFEQFISLSLLLLFEPLDPRDLHAWLLLGEHPLPSGLRNWLAGVVQGTPGIGGRDWNHAVEKWAEKIEDGTYRKKIQDTLQFWLFLNRPSKPSEISMQRILQGMEWLSDWLYSRQFNPDDDFRNYIISSRHRLDRLRDTLLRSGSKKDIEKPELIRILSLWARPSLNLHHAEVGHPAVATSDGTCVNQAENIIWFEPFSLPSPRKWPWSSEELNAFGKCGVDVQFHSRLASLYQLQALKPLFSARESIKILVHGRCETPHPILTRLRGIFENLPSYRIEDSMAANTLLTSGFLVERNFQPLPEPKSWWQLSDQIDIEPREIESCSSYEKLILQPWWWVLEVKAGFYEGKFGQPEVDNLMFGNLGHRVMEEYFHEYRNYTQSPGLESWLEKRLNELVKQEAALLLLPGYRVKHEELFARLKYAIGRLEVILDQSNIRQADSEVRLQGTLGSQKIRGRCDLLLEDASGVPGVIDFKWGGQNHYRKQLASGNYFQLALYTHLIKDSENKECEPFFAWLFLKDGSSLAAASTSFHGISDIIGPASQVLDPSGVSRSLEISYEWRLEQLRRGLVQVTVSNARPVESKEAITPPEGGIEIPDENDKFSPFSCLTGWGGA